ncbi:uncharacterized protein G2W53_027269 [Senna tora]|uniref:Uncharacterized protein n=1 Tax=Senna tora TaxID=362788 RepID=A0A834TIQ5_9FABA|nr:uncharacterized protein G2W53_027269 [Senna tora]
MGLVGTVVPTTMLLASTIRIPEYAKGVT